jgi:hypothetical protein
MSVSNRSQVVIIKAEGDASAKADLARVALKKQLGRKSRDNVRAILLPDFAFVYKVALVAGAGKAEGTKVLDSDASAYEACRKALGRTVTFICGAKESNSVELPKKLVNNLIKEIKVAQLTKAQLNALFAAVREGLQ